MGRERGDVRGVPVLDGFGNVDRLFMPTADGAEAFEGFTLRLYDPGTDTWRIWWSSTRAPGVFDEPVVGRFDDGHGTFECDDVVGGHPVRVRFTWHRGDPAAPRWEQRFSFDGGATWVLNWVMQLARAA